MSLILLGRHCHIIVAFVHGPIAIIAGTCYLFVGLVKQPSCTSHAFCHFSMQHHWQKGYQIIATKFLKTRHKLCCLALIAVCQSWSPSVSHVYGVAIAWILTTSYTRPLHTFHDIMPVTRTLKCYSRVSRRAAEITTQTVSKPVSAF